MSTLSTRIQDLATRIATECKSMRTLINGNATDLSALTTTAKSNLVAAVNELKAGLEASQLAAGAQIDDSEINSTSKTWSVNKITSEITDAVNAVLNGAPSALDTLEELAAAIGDDANFAATITDALGNRVRTDTAAQGLTTTQRENARTNIGADITTAQIGNPDTDFVTIFQTGLA